MLPLTAVSEAARAPTPRLPPDIFSVPILSGLWGLIRTSRGPDGGRVIDRRCYISSWTSIDGRAVFEPWAVATKLVDMANADPAEVILEYSEAVTAVVGCLVVAAVGSESSPTRLQLLALRNYEDRPLQFSPGSPLSAINLPRGYFTADITHVVLWPDGFAAQDFHSEAPRLSRLSTYLRKQLSVFVQFDSLFDPSIVDHLADIAGEIRSVDIALTSPGRSSAVNQGVFSNLFPSAFGDRAPSDQRPAWHGPIWAS